MANFASAYGIALNMDYVLSIQKYGNSSIEAVYTDGSREVLTPSVPMYTTMDTVIEALYSSLNRNWN